VWTKENRERKRESASHIMQLHYKRHMLARSYRYTNAFRTHRRKNKMKTLIRGDRRIVSLVCPCLFTFLYLFRSETIGGGGEGGVCVRRRRVCMCVHVCE
jgi:hypothetical protein